MSQVFGTWSYRPDEPFNLGAPATFVQLPTAQLVFDPKLSSIADEVQIQEQLGLTRDAQGWIGQIGNAYTATIKIAFAGAVLDNWVYFTGVTDPNIDLSKTGLDDVYFGTITDTGSTVSDIPLVTSSTNSFVLLPEGPNIPNIARISFGTITANQGQQAQAYSITISREIN